MVCGTPHIHSYLQFIHTQFANALNRGNNIEVNQCNLLRFSVAYKLIY